MQRMIYLLVFFTASLFVLKPAWGILMDRPVTETTQAAPSPSKKESNSQLPREKNGGRPQLYRPNLRADGHLKLENDSGYIFTSPFDEARPTVGAMTAGAAGSLRLTGLAKSSRGIRAVIEQGQAIITLSEGETKAGITLLEIDEAEKTIVIHSSVGRRVLRLTESQP